MSLFKLGFVIVLNEPFEIYYLKKNVIDNISLNYMIENFRFDYPQKLHLI